MKKIIATALLLVMILGVMTSFTTALADSYNGKTKYAGWYTVYRTSNCLSINNKPKSSSNRDVTRNATAQNGDMVYITDAQASAGSAKKWGRVSKVKHNGTEKAVNGYACMYYLKKASPDAVDTAKRITKSNAILDDNFGVGRIKVTDEMTVIVNNSTGKIEQYSCNSYYSTSGLCGLINISSKISAYNVQNTYVEFQATHTLSGSVSIFNELGLSNRDTFVCHYRLDNQGKLTKLDGYWR